MTGDLVTSRLIQARKPGFLGFPKQPPDPVCCLRQCRGAPLVWIVLCSTSRVQASTSERWQGPEELRGLSGARQGYAMLTDMPADLRG